MKFRLITGEAKEFDYREMVALQSSDWFSPEPIKAVEPKPVEAAPVVTPVIPKAPVFVKRKPGRPRKS